MFSIINPSFSAALPVACLFSGDAAADFR